MRLFVERSVRRCVGLAILLFFTVPFGLSVIGCSHHSAPPVYCNSGNSGPVVGQASSITLALNLAIIGESLNYGQIGSGLSATTADCKGNSVSVSKYTYSSTNLNFADINPTPARSAVAPGTATPAAASPTSPSAARPPTRPRTPWPSSPPTLTVSPQTPSPSTFIPPSPACSSPHRNLPPRAAVRPATPPATAAPTPPPA